VQLEGFGSQHLILVHFDPFALIGVSEYAKWLSCPLEMVCAFVAGEGLALLHDDVGMPRGSEAGLGHTIRRDGLAEKSARNDSFACGVGVKGKRCAVLLPKFDQLWFGGYRWLVSPHQLRDSV
jgi:hypothetical protein